MVDEEKEGTEEQYKFTPPEGDGNASDNLESSASQELRQTTPTPELEEAYGKNEGSEDSIGHTITVGKAKYAVGLFWQPLQDVDDPIPEIRGTMETDVGSDLYCIHYGRVAQYGLTKKANGAKEGQAAAAISVLDALSDKSSFVAVFKTQEGWWFVAARNDLILPEEDVLYANEADAKDAFFSMMAVPDWGHKIAPAEWKIDDTEPLVLEELIRKAFQVHLVSLSAARGTKILLALALLVLFIVGAIVFLIFHLYERKTTPSINIAPIEELAGKIGGEPIIPANAEEKPWDKIPDVNSFLERCWDYSYRLKSLTIPGWSLGNIVCTKENITTEWKMTWTKGGRFAWFTTAMTELSEFKQIATQVNEAGNLATASIAFSQLPIANTQLTGPRYTVIQLKQEITDIAQALSMNISMQVQEIAVGGSNSPQQGGASGVTTYKYLSFSFSSPMDPPSWEAFFDKFPGLEIVKVQYNPQAESALTENWSYEGRIYEKQQ